MSVQLKTEPAPVSTKPSVSSNAAVTVQQVEQLLQGKIGSTLKDLIIEIVDGTIYVSGHANAFYIKQKVSHLIMSAHHDLDLINKIKVD